MAREPKPPPAEPVRPFQPSADYLLAIVLAWLVPGAGHLILGWRFRSAAIAVLLLGMFWFGEATAGGWAVIREEHDYFYWAQIGNGLSTVLADKLQWGDVTPKGGEGIDRTIPPFLTTGILLTSISGLLNMLLIIHVMDPRTWDSRPPAPAPGEARRKP